jgi:predicted amidophosphoribosyltransferase
MAGVGSRAWRAAGSRLRDLLWPPVCAGCGAETADALGLCAACFAATPFISGPVCDRCGLPLPGGGAEDVCDACLHAPPAWRRARAAALYEGAARRAALALKHGDRLDVAEAAAVWMLRAGGALVTEADLVAPAPLHWTRLFLRRANQSAELARAILRRAGRPEAAAYDLLTRARRTPSQEGRTRVARIANVAGAFRVTPRWSARVRGARVLLIDDVLTTGATLSACAAALSDAGAARVDALVLARVAREAEPPA